MKGNKLCSLLLSSLLAISPAIASSNSVVLSVSAQSEGSIYGQEVNESVLSQSTVSGNTIVEDYVKGTGTPSDPITFNAKCEALYQDYLEPGLSSNPTKGWFSFWGAVSIKAPDSKYTNCTYYSSLLGNETDECISSVNSSTQTATVYLDVTQASLFSQSDDISKTATTDPLIIVTWKAFDGSQQKVYYSLNLEYTKAVSLLSIGETEGFSMYQTEISQSSWQYPTLKQSTVFTGNVSEIPETLKITVPFPAIGTSLGGGANINTYKVNSGGTLKENIYRGVDFYMDNLEEGLNLGQFEIIFDVGDGETFQKGFGINYSVSVYINDTPSVFDSIEISPEESELEVGKTLTLTAKTTPEASSSTKYTWSTPTPDQISIKSDGNKCEVKALKPGNAAVMVSAGSNQVTDFAAIKVVESTGGSETAGSITSQDTITGEYITETVTEAGVTSTTTQNSNGEIKSIVISIPGSAIQNGEALIDLGTNTVTNKKLVISGNGTNADLLPVLSIEIPEKGSEVQITLPLSEKSGLPGTVAMVVNTDGTLSPIVSSLSTSDSISFPLSLTSKIVIKNNAQTFSDVSAQSQYKNGIDFMSARGLMNAYTPNNFGITDPVTRGMLAQILYNIAGQPVVDSSWTIPTGAENWWERASTWAFHEKLMGQGGSTFYGEMTRTQLALVLYRMVGSPLVSISNLSSYADAAEIPYGDEAVKAWSWAVSKGIMGDNTPVLMPDSLATREQIAKIFYAFALAVPEEFK